MGLASGQCFSLVAPAPQCARGFVWSAHKHARVPLIYIARHDFECLAFDHKSYVAPATLFPSFLPFFFPFLHIIYIYIYIWGIICCFIFTGHSS